MRLSTRLLSNAFTTYLRLGTTFVLGLFTTWYTLERLGVVGFGLLALAVSSTGPSRALERALRFGMIREQAAAIASGDPDRVRRSTSAAMHLCRRVAWPLLGIASVAASLAWLGVFNTPADRPKLEIALAVLVLGEGVHAAGRMLAAPYLQALFAAQRVATDNLLQVLARATYAVSTVIVFGWLLAGRDLHVQLTGFAVSRVTLQLADVALGIWLARRGIPGLAHGLGDFDEEEYRAVRGTVWHSSQVTLLLNINPQLLAVLINLFFGLTYNTIWQIVVQFAGFARMFAEGILRGIEPLAAHLHESGRRGATIELMTRSIRYQLAAVLPAVIFLAVHAHALLDLWVGRRLASDPELIAAGMTGASALELTALMASIMLAMQALRAGFFGVERVLYGMGEVRSYSWYAKWSTLLCIGSAAIGMAWLRDPVVAPISVLVAHSLFSPVLVLAAARRAAGLPLAAALRSSLPGPLSAGVAFWAIMRGCALWLPSLSAPILALLMVVAGATYCPLAFLLVIAPDERARLVQMAGKAWEWLRHRLVR